MHTVPSDFPTLYNCEQDLLLESESWGVSGNPLLSPQPYSILSGNFFRPHSHPAAFDSKHHILLVILGE